MGRPASSRPNTAPSTLKCKVMKLNQMWEKNHKFIHIHSPCKFQKGSTLWNLPKRKSVGRTIWHISTGISLISILAKNLEITGRRGVVVSASDSRSEDSGFESQLSQAGFFGPRSAPTQSGCAMDPMGRQFSTLPSLTHYTCPSMGMLPDVWHTVRLSLGYSRANRAMWVITRLASQVPLHTGSVAIIIMK